MNIVKCPNPNCPFQFDASLVPPAAVISCPQCRLQFQLPAAAYGAPAPPPPPVESADVEPLDADPAPPADRGERRRGRRDDGDSPRRSRSSLASAKGKGGGMAALIAVVVVGFGLVCCGGTVGAGFLLGWFKGKVSDAGDHRFEEYGLSFNGPGDGWAKDDATLDTLKVNLMAFKRTGPEGYVAVKASKTNGEARKGDLAPQARAVLAPWFEDLDETFIPQEAKLLGQPAEKYEFSGRYKPTGTGCHGEVYAVAVGKTMVWVYTWADRDGYDQLAPAFDQFRASLKLDAAKSGGPKVERKSPVDIRTNSGLFALSDSEGEWNRQPDPTIKDAAGDLLLYGYKRLPTTGKLATKEEAYLVVAVLDPEGEAKEQARKHIIPQFNDPTETNELEGDPDGDPPAGGPVPATDKVTRLTLKYGGQSTDWLMAFATVDSGNKRVVVYAWAPLKERAYWEQRLMLIVGTLKALK